MFHINYLLKILFKKTYTANRVLIFTICKNRIKPFHFVILSDHLFRTYNFWATSLEISFCSLWFKLFLLRNIRYNSIIRFFVSIISVIFVMLSLCTITRWIFLTSFNKTSLSNNNSMFLFIIWWTQLRVSIGTFRFNCPSQTLLCWNFVLFNTSICYLGD